MVEVVAIAMALDHIALVLRTLVLHKVQTQVLSRSPLVGHHVCVPVAPSTHLSALVFLHASS